MAQAALIRQHASKDARCYLTMLGLTRVRSAHEVYANKTDLQHPKRGPADYGRQWDAHHHASLARSAYVVLVVAWVGQYDGQTGREVPGSKEGSIAGSRIFRQ